MRMTSAAEERRRQLSSRTGLDDPQLVQELEALGFTAETVQLLFFLPLVHVAWAEWGVSEAERGLILQLARRRGIEDASPADQQLKAWLSKRPDVQVFASASRLIRAMLDAPGADAMTFTRDELMTQCENIAGASGALLGFNRVSLEERTILTTLARDLRR
jgi:hypothetical protein